ncbi:MAG: DciA family protein [Kiritimatiellia bacterium]
MLESKNQFSNNSGKAGRLKEIYSSTTAEERAMQTHRHRGRSTLTPSDHEHNRRVRTLFNNIIPGLPIDADPPELYREPDPMAKLVEKAMEKLDIETRGWLDELKEAWSSILPPEITRKAEPGKFENNILFVYVRSSVELFDLRRTRLKEIETAVRRFAPDKNIRHVRLMVNYSPL